MNKEDIQQALRDAGEFQKMYHRCATALAILLLVFCALLAIEAKALLSIALIIVAYAGFLAQERRSKQKYQAATEELNALLDELADSTGEIPLEMISCLSPQTQAFLNQEKEMYGDRKAAIFASICLGVIALTVLIVGAIIVKFAGYAPLDVPALIVGIFMLFMGTIVAIEAIKWIARIPKSRSNTQD